MTGAWRAGASIRLAEQRAAVAFGNCGQCLEIRHAFLSDRNAAQEASDTIFVDRGNRYFESNITKLRMDIHAASISAYRDTTRGCDAATGNGPVSRNESTISKYMAG